MLSSKTEVYGNLLCRRCFKKRALPCSGRMEIPVLVLLRIYGTMLNQAIKRA